MGMTSRLRAVPLQSVKSKLGRTGESKLAERETGEAGRRGTAFSLVTDAFKFLRGPSIGELDWLINNRMLSVHCHCNL